MKASAAIFEIEEFPPAMRGQALRVLLVDRARGSLASAVSWIEEMPCVEVFAFSSAEEALTQSSGDSYDLCLLDYCLDGVNGVMLGAMIRALNPGARMLLMSEVLSPHVERQAVEHGFQAVIPKPITKEKLEQLLAQSRIMAVS